MPFRLSRFALSTFSFCSCFCLIIGEAPLSLIRKNGFVTGGVSYYPNTGEKVKRANKLYPGPETDKHGNIMGQKMPLISMVKEDIELSSTYGKPKLPRSF